ncbi:MAG: hypothetical protein ACYS74_15355 [Planctomycetota bacterium]|jgi:hypothetical protein
MTILNGSLFYLRYLDSYLALMLKKNELSSAASVRQSKYITKAIDSAEGLIDCGILADTERSIIEELLGELRATYNACTTFPDRNGEQKEYTCAVLSASGWEEELIVLESRIKNRFFPQVQKMLSDRPLIVTGKPPGKAGQGRGKAGEWSTPMSKAEMMARLDIDSYKTFNAFAKKHGIDEAGNRQTFTIRLDGMDARTRSKLEKK